MERRNFGFGSILMGSYLVLIAVTNAFLNRNSVPPLMSGLIYELLAYALVGVAFILTGAVLYTRSRQPSR